MKSASTGLKNLLATSNEFFHVDLYTVTLQNGTILRYTNADGDIVYGGNTYSRINIDTDKVKTIVGTQVDSMNVTINADSNTLVSGVPFPQFVLDGGFDGALMKCDKLFMSTYGDTSLGTASKFSGYISDVKPSRTAVVLVVSSYLDYLNIQMPRNLYSPGCIHNLYDAGCTLNKASFGSTSSALAGSTQTSIVCGLVQANGYFDVGTMTFTSGQNSGIARTIKTYTTGLIIPSLPLPHPVAAGDTFTAYAGCDKTQSTCTSKFSNLTNYRGFPYIPVPEASL